MQEYSKESMFEGRRLLIATKHKKENAIASVLQEALGVECVVADGFDTDVYGTFTGEVERENDPITTVRKKCLKAMELYGCDLGVASEGSFGPHPSCFFLNADEEILIFIDKQHNLEIITRELSTDTNFNGEEIQTESQLIEFAERAYFPSHALILRESKDSHKDVIKGISNWEQLQNSFSRLQKEHESIYVETDMRAMYNPKRMKVIGEATQKLVEKIRSCCPECATPGFGITKAKAGLPCRWCDSPTQSTLSYIYECQKCSFIKEDMFPHEKIAEDPMYCYICNP